MYIPVPPPVVIHIPEDCRPLLQASPYPRSTAPAAAARVAQAGKTPLPDSPPLPQTSVLPGVGSKSRSKSGSGGGNRRRRSLIERLNFKKKPYTAVTVQVDRLTSESYEENDFSGIPDLIESIRLQDSGPSEASRAIRKKL